MHLLVSERLGSRGCVTALSLSVPAGKVNVTISTQHTEELCDTEVPMVKAQRDVDTDKAAGCEGEPGWCSVCSSFHTMHGASPKTA